MFELFKKISILAVVVVFFGFAGQAVGQDVWGTSSAEMSTDPGFEGLWKYCLDIGWDISGTGVGLSHFSLNLNLAGCDCICEEAFFSFADPAGSGPGTPDPCTVYYRGQFQCTGDPTIPGLDVPTIKYEHTDGACEPGDTGTMVVCFYSPAGPDTPQIYVDALIVKAGVDVLRFGDLNGVMPICDCAVPADHSNWGRVKSMFR